MLKLIYLARRKPGFTVDEFVRRWRMHGAKAMAMPLWRYALGYVQAEPIRPAPVRGASEEFDAIACYTVRDDMFTGMTDEDIAGAAGIVEDELETFSGPISAVSLWVSEEQIKSGEPGGVTAFMFFKNAETARAMAQRACDAGDCNRITLNVRDDSVFGAQGNTLSYEAIVELSCCSTPALLTAVEANGQGLQVTSDLCVVTREAVLWDRLQR
jgi:EthD domain